jgi:hypothetical protein
MISLVLDSDESLSFIATFIEFVLPLFFGGWVSLFSFLSVPKGETERVKRFKESRLGS